MSSQNYEEEAEEVRQASDQAEADRRKDEVGMAEFGTEEYYANARYILGAYTRPSEETKAKRGY